MPFVKATSEVREHRQTVAPSLSDSCRVSRVNDLLGDKDTSALPVWIRAPKSGPEYWTGFGRSKLYELHGRGRIKSKSIREPGQIKGTRLFNLRSILDYIDGCDNHEAEQREVPV
jgi:hypothetical protein